MGNQNEINAEVKFIEVGGKFIWKIYDENGSVVEKAKELFDNKEACEADFNAFCENSETVGIEDVDTGIVGENEPAAEVETTPETPESIETTPVEVVSEEVIENQPVEQSQPETVIENAEVKTEVAPEGAIEGSAEGIETAKL